MARSRKLRKRESRPRRKTNKRGKKALRAKTTKRAARRTRVKARRPRRHARVTRRRMHKKGGRPATIKEAYSHKTIAGTGKNIAEVAAVHKPVPTKPAHMMSDPFGSGSGIGKAVGTSGSSKGTSGSSKGTSGSTKSSGSGWGVVGSKACETGCEVAWGVGIGATTLTAGTLIGRKIYMRMRGNKIQITDDAPTFKDGLVDGSLMKSSQPYVGSDGKLGIAYQLEDGRVGVLNWTNSLDGKMKITTRIASEETDPGLYNDLQSALATNTSDPTDPTTLDSYSSGGVVRSTTPLTPKEQAQFRANQGRNFYGEDVVKATGESMPRLGSVSKSGSGTEFTGTDSTNGGLLRVRTRVGNTIREITGVDFDSIPPELRVVFEASAGGGGNDGLYRFNTAMDDIRTLDLYQQKLATATAEERGALLDAIEEVKGRLRGIGEQISEEGEFDPLDGGVE